MKRKMIMGALLAALSGVAVPYVQAEDSAADAVMLLLSGTDEQVEPPADAPAQPEEPKAETPAPAQPEEPKAEKIDTEATSETSETGEQPAAPKADAPAPAERVLSKPGVALYTEPQDDKKSTDYLPNYSILTVMEHQDNWLHVSVKSKGDGADTLAWVKAEDIIPWKHQLVACFAPPANRQRVLFFNSKEEALRLNSLPEEERKAELEKIYAALEKGEDIPNAAVIAAEPDGWAEMQNNFYLLPITDFTEDDSEIGDEFAVQAIQVSAATENTENVAEATDTHGMKLDLVFVIDLSRSMNPVKDQVMATIRRIAEAVKSNPQFNDDMVHFGLWGYRDDTELCKGIEYVTKDYTAEGLLAAGDFVSVLQNATATEVDSIDYAEDVLAGVKDAVQQTKWRGDAAKTIILIGDAPGRERGKTDPFSKRKDKPVGTAADMDIEQIVALAQENQVDIGTLYLNVARHKQYLPLGRQQFEKLATKTQEQATKVVDVNSQDDFDCFAAEVITMLVAQVQQASTGKDEIRAVTEGQKFSTSLFRNAKVRWLARNHKVGVTPEMSGWILDKDLMDMGLDSVTPCVLLNRAQLEQMNSLLTNVIAAGKKAKGSNSALLTALKTIVVAGASDADLLDDVHTISDARFVPSFLKELPYRSAVMSLSNDYWQAMTSAEQDRIIQDAESKLNFYASLYENADVWMTPDENSGEDSKVVAVPLNQLP